MDARKATAIQHFLVAKRVNMSLDFNVDNSNFDKRVNSTVDDNNSLSKVNFVEKRPN